MQGFFTPTEAGPSDVRGSCPGRGEEGYEFQEIFYLSDRVTTHRRMLLMLIAGSTILVIS